MAVPLFDIGPDITGIFRDGIDTLILQLGKPCLIVGDGPKLPCSNCFFDSLSGKSAGAYNGTGPQPFTRAPCPVCRGSGYDPASLERRVEKRFLINRDVKPNRIVAPNTDRPRTIARIKGFAADARELLTMRHIILDHLNQTITQERYVKLSEPEYAGNIVSGRYFSMYLERAG